MASEAKIKLSHHYVTAPDGAKLSYYSAGTGDGVLVLHGAFSYALMHSELAVELGPHYTVHLVSRRGRGLSEPYPSSVTDLNPPYEQPLLAKKNTAASKSDGDSSEPNSAADPTGAMKVGSKTYTRTYKPELTTAVIATEVSDLEALIEATGAIYIIGISSGALLTLEALFQDSKSPALSKIRKAIIFEPPILFTDRSTTVNLDKLPQFEHELGEGDVVGAAVTAMHMVQLGPTWIPRWLMKVMSGIMFRAQDREVEKKRAKIGEDAGVCTMSGLTRLLRYDFVVVEGMVAESQRYRDLSRLGDELSQQKIEILLLSGAGSPGFLVEGMDTLRKTIAGAKSIVIEGVGHELLCNAEMRGQPARALPTIREFFA